MATLPKKDLSPSGVVLLQKKKADNVPDKKQIAEKETIFSLRQKYKNVVLMEIYENEGILHSVLTNRICSSASGVNATIRRLNEAFPPPIRVKRQGKFTLYSLEKEGKIYVEKVLLPSIASNEEDRETIHNIFRLLSTFKDKNSKDWPGNLEKILNGQEELDDYDEGLGFIKELTKYYLKSNEEAESFLNLAIVDSELKEKLIDYIKETQNYAFENCWEILNYWEQEDTLEVYKLIDSIFDSIAAGEDILDYDTFSLTHAKLHLETISDKIQAILLRAFLKRLSKEGAVNLWLAYGIDIHLAIYLAEKYLNCRLHYEQMIEERIRCI